MAKVLVVDCEGTGLSFAWRCALAGHEVRWFVKPNPCRSNDIGKGFRGITKVDNWVSSVMWADIVFPTGNGHYLDRLDFFKKRGARVFGPTQKSADLEIKRKQGMEFLEKIGLPVAPYEVFKDIQEAELYVRKTKERFVFKTLGDNDDKALTYVSKDAADLLEWMKRMRMAGKEPPGEVMLQTFVKGIEMGVSRWMGKTGWVGPWNENFEFKKHMSSNYGPNTGEMGTIAAYTRTSKLGEQTLEKCREGLLKLGHLGDVDIGFIIEENTGKLYPTEFTVRPGWPIFNMMLGAIKNDPVQWMIDAIDGKDTTNFSEDIGCCLVAAHGDFPHTSEYKSEYISVPVYGVTKSNSKHIHPQDIKIDTVNVMDGKEITRKPIWTSAGDYLFVVTGFSDKSIEQARERAYGTIKQLSLSNMQVRDDVGEDLKEKLPILQKYGFATHFKYSTNKEGKA